MKAPCVYLLANRYRGTLYVGVTSDLAQRVSQHRLGLVEGFTRKYGVKSLVWYEPQETMEAAISAGEKPQGLEAGVEDRADRTLEPELDRPVRDAHAVTKLDCGVRRNDD